MLPRGTKRSWSSARRSASRDQRRADVGEEEEDHHRRQDGAEHQVFLHGGQRRLGEHRLVIDNLQKRGLVQRQKQGGPQLLSNKQRLIRLPMEQTM